MGETLTREHLDRLYRDGIGDEEFDDLVSMARAGIDAREEFAAHLERIKVEMAKAEPMLLAAGRKADEQIATLTADLATARRELGEVRKDAAMMRLLLTAMQLCADCGCCAKRERCNAIKELARIDAAALKGTP